LSYLPPSGAVAADLLSTPGAHLVYDLAGLAADRLKGGAAHEAEK
jgi:hypothetical protein